MGLNVKVGFIGVLDMLKFKNMSKNRDKVIEATPTKEVDGDFKINILAKKLHPDFQQVIVSNITSETDAKIITFKAVNNNHLAFFRAGQYLSVYLKVGKSVVSRPYSICSSPTDALKGIYKLCIKNTGTNAIADWIYNNLSVGVNLLVSGPEGQMYFDKLRDCNNVIALAGGSGITPFVSMAEAIRDGIENFNLTIIYGSRTEKDILFKDHLKNIASTCNNVKIVNVLSDENKEGYENGFITSDLIKKYAPKDNNYSLFVCGPSAMYSFVKKQVENLGLSSSKVRYEVQGMPQDIASNPDFNPELKDKEFNVTVKQGPNTYTLKASSCQPLLVAIEKAGISAPARCRAGECGWCRSKLVSGKVYIPKDNDYRRFADKQFNYIHPCACYPISDIVVEIPGSYISVED